MGDISRGNVVIDNKGNAPCSLEIEIPGGVVTPVTITNETTGEFIRVKTDIPLGSYLYISTKFGNLEVSIVDNEGNKTNAFNYIDLESSFFQLCIGKNEISYLAGVGSDDIVVKIKYKQEYLGL